MFTSSLEKVRKRSSIPKKLVFTGVKVMKQSKSIVMMRPINCSLIGGLMLQNNQRTLSAFCSCNNNIVANLVYTLFIVVTTFSYLRNVPTVIHLFLFKSSLILLTWRWFNDSFRVRSLLISDTVAPRKNLCQSNTSMRHSALALSIGRCKYPLCKQSLNVW
jgi:hypothetical protein